MITTDKMVEPDIAHISFKPPFVPGSYNRTVGSTLKKLPQYRQVMISYWNGMAPDSYQNDPNLILINKQGLSVQQQIYLRLPESLRRHWYNGIRGHESLIYSWGVLKTLEQLKPKLIICYDNYKLGKLIKKRAIWNHRLILSQHGLSYFLPVPEATRLYSLQSFDGIWALTYASYRFDRVRSSLYEPIVHVIPNYVDTDRFTPVSTDEKAGLREKWQLPKDRQIVLFLSRLVPKKGVHTLVYSWKKIIERFPSAFLWIVGGGSEDYIAYLSGIISAQGITNSVYLQGSAVPEDVPSCFQASDVYVFPTLCTEGQAMTLLEAMSCGLPSVVSQHMSIDGLLNEEHGVLTVPDPNLADAFIEPLISLLEDVSLREIMGKKAQAYVREVYSEAMGMKRLTEFYSRELSMVRDL